MTARSTSMSRATSAVPMCGSVDEERADPLVAGGRRSQHRDLDGPGLGCLVVQWHLQRRALEVLPAGLPLQRLPVERGQRGVDAGRRIGCECRRGFAFGVRVVGRAGRRECRDGQKHGQRGTVHSSSSTGVGRMPSATAPSYACREPQTLAFGHATRRPVSRSRTYTVCAGTLYPTTVPSTPWSVLTPQPSAGTLTLKSW